MENLITCGICHEDQITDLGEIDSCFHRFCFPCINQWAAIESKCPFCKVRFTRVTHKQLASPTKLAHTDFNGVLPGNVISVDIIPERDQRVVFEDPTFIEWINNVGCVVCGSSENEAQLLLCDGCDQACHTYCVGLTDVPEGDWFCTACTASRARQARRQQRQEPVVAAAGTRRRRRSPSPIGARSLRQRIDSLEDSDSEDDDDVRIVRRPGRRQRQGPAPGARRSQTVRRNNSLDDDLDGFVVSDSEESEEESDLEEDSPLERRYRPPQRERGVGARRGQNGGGAGPAPAGGRRTTQQQRRQQAPSPIVLDSESEEWTSNDSDEAPEVVVGRNGRGERRGVGATAAAQQPQRGQRGTLAVRDGEPAPPLRRRIAGRGNDRDVGGGQSAAQRRVAAISHSWGALRAGISTFEDIVGDVPRASTSSQQQQQQEAPRRRRLQTARQLEESQGRLNRAPVIDLTSTQESPSPAPKPTREQRKEEERRNILSPPLLSLSSRLRAELAQCSERGAQLLPRNRPRFSGGRHPPTTTTTATLGSRAGVQPPASSTPIHMNPSAAVGSGPLSSSGRRRMRTVGDFAAGAAMARNTPGDNGSGGSGPHNASGGVRRDNNTSGGGRGSTEWRGAGAGSASHQLPWQRSNLHRQQQGQPRSGGLAPVPAAQLQSFAYTNGRGSQEKDRNQERNQERNRDRNHVNSDGRSSPRPLHERLQQRSAAAAAPLPPPPPPPLPPAAPSILPGQGSGSQTPLGLQRPRHLRAVIDADMGAGPSTARTPPRSTHIAIPSSPGGFDSPSPRKTTGSFWPNPKFLSKDLVKAHLRVMFSPGDLTVDQLKEVTKRASQAVYRDHGADATEDHAAMAIDEALKDMLGRK